MKKTLLGLLLISATGFAADVSNSISFQPCSWWKYDFESSAYVCQSTGMTTRVYTDYEVDRLIQNLENKIQQLEARVAKLEGR